MEVTGVESEVELARRVVEEEQLVASGQEHVVPLDLGVQIRHHGVAGTIVISGAETTSLAGVRAAISQEGVSQPLSESHVRGVAVRRGLHSCILHICTAQQLVLLPQMSKLISPAQVNSDPNYVIVI